MVTNPHTRRLLLSLCAAALLLPASYALAAPVRTVSATTPVANNQEGSATASCRHGEHVASAGFRATLSAAQGVIPIRMVPTGTTVLVGGMNIMGDGTVTANAYCTKTDPGKKTGKKKKGKKKGQADAAKGKKKKKKKKSKPPVPVSSTVQVLPADATGTATATCPPGTTVRAGGFDTGSGFAGSNLLVLTVFELASPTQLRVRADNLTANGNSLTAIALCGRGPALTAVEGATTPLPVGGDGATATAVCPAGRRVAFAGLRTAGDTTETFTSELTRPSDSTAQATAYSVDMGNTLTPIAYCEPA